MKSINFLFDHSMKPVDLPQKYRCGKRPLYLERPRYKTSTLLLTPLRQSLCGWYDALFRMLLLDFVG